MRLVLALAALATMVVVGCETRSSEPGPGGTETDGGAAIGAPRFPPAGVVFRDSDLKPGFLANHIIVKKAADESDIIEYRAYFGSSAEKRFEGPPLATAIVTGSDVKIAMPNGTKAPDGATHLLVYSANANGEYPKPSATELSDNQVSGGPLSEGSTVLDFRRPQIAIDKKNHKVIVSATTAELPNAPPQLRLVICDSGLKGCKVIDPGGVGTYRSAIALDEAGGKLYVANSVPLGVVICNLDGTACANKPIPGWQGATGVDQLSAVVDAKNQRLLVVADYGKPVLHRCNLDGSQCSTVDIAASTGTGSRSGTYPTAMIDTAKDKLLIAATDMGPPDPQMKPRLFKCGLDGTACTTHDASGGATTNAALAAAVFDAQSSNIFIMSRVHFPTNALEEHATLSICNATTAACKHVDVSAGQGNSQRGRAGIAYYAPTDSLFYLNFAQPAPQENEQGRGLYIARCAADGTGCVRHFLTTPSDPYFYDLALAIDENHVYALADSHAFVFQPW